MGEVWTRKTKIYPGQIKTNKEIASLTGHTDSISSVAISHDRLLIASSSKDKTIKLCHQ
ncbi:hypothetical protein IQ231_18785 [Cuspidothrix issatschenkoi LEGE 03284]|uniref:WD40 repeat domain-containing protein n=1 Tax=Cuspidothrix issatschenkoi TaxID=230752 RepID=UPI001882DF58|nr:hypothetical protein [Cuspidothrix issatschenkoi]MBE9233658.1 hypothetical protein [Cuspidothrix issatschenkoi LEGE 03284]